MLYFEIVRDYNFVHKDWLHLIVVEIVLNYMKVVEPVDIQDIVELVVDHMGFEAMYLVWF